MRRLEARFEGRVQGVGFRFTVVDLASKHGVVGFVQNESDGAVYIVAEGEQDVLVDFLNDVRSSPVGRFIMKEHVDWRRATGEYSVFDVIYTQ